MPKDGGASHPAGEGAGRGYTRPAWLGPVKAAVAVMTVLIIAGVVLLVYGLATGVGGLAGKGHPRLRLSHPAAMEPIQVAPGADGGIMVLFEGPGGTREVVVIDPDGVSITRRVTLEPGGDGFRLGE